MKFIEHFFHPTRLWLCWQPAALAGKRMRRIVAEVVQAADGGGILRYLADTPDYRSAVEQGFHGYPAFRTAQVEHRSGVMEAFMRRLPPRSREDFVEYLRMYRLPPTFTAPDI